MPLALSGQRRCNTSAEPQDMVEADLHDLRVDHCVFQVRLVRERVEDALEDIGGTAVATASERRTPVAEPLRQIVPRTARARDPRVHARQDRTLHKQRGPIALRRDIFGRFTEVDSECVVALP